MPKISKNPNFDKKQSKEVDVAIKKLENDLKSNAGYAMADSALIGAWNCLLACCKNIECKENAVSHIDEDNKLGLLAFVNGVKGLNDNNFNGKDILHPEDSVKPILSFLRDANKYEIKESKIAKIISCCKKILKNYSKLKTQNKDDKYEDKRKQSSRIIDKICESLLFAKKIYYDAHFGLERNGKKVSISDCDKHLGDAFDNLCALAEREGKFSSKSRKGLAGWYEDHKNDGHSIDEIYDAIFDITEDKYVKGTGFLGVGKSRLGEIVEVVEELKGSKEKYEKALKEYEKKESSKNKWI